MTKKVVKKIRKLVRFGMIEVWIIDENEIRRCKNAII